ncbi:MAG TPA: calcium/sodium antiporter [Longimicrobiaceae bacterium]|nr:calcium/sodium antiporter [Longimicrobiaceae bacterium]
MSPLTMVLFVLGIAILIAGAELLVRGASRLAAGLGISPLVVGLTVVAFGTSSPEMAVSAQSALAGQTDLALGNVVGSNIFNVLFILGVSAMIAPLVVAQQLVRLDVPLMIGASVAVLLLGLDGAFGRLDGALFFGGAVAYTTFLVRQSRRETAAVQAQYEGEFGEAAVGAASWLRDSALVLGGLVLLVLGSRWLVNGAVEIATTLGVDELVIGLTIVAAGTSLPEVATSVLASLRGERDIAVGNVVGSNLFNILAVLGFSGLVAPGGVDVAPAALRFDVPVMIAVAVACLPIFFSGHRISRWEGLLFFGYYVAYTAYLVLAATRSEVLPEFSGAMVFFVLPLTAVTLAVVGLREIRSRRGGGATGAGT